MAFGQCESKQPIGIGAPETRLSDVPPELPVKAKRKLIKSVNAAVAKAYNNLPGLLILFLEYPQDRVGISGNLNSDDQKHLEGLSRSIGVDPPKYEDNEKTMAESSTSIEFCETNE